MNQYYTPPGRYGLPSDYPPEESIKMAESYLNAADAHFAEGAYDTAEREYRSAGICYGRAGVRQEADPLDRIGIQVQECRSRMANRHPMWVERVMA